jgi:hypothetical protein
MSGRRLIAIDDLLAHFPLGAIPAVLIDDQGAQAETWIGSARRYAGAGQFAVDRIRDRARGAEWIGARSGVLTKATKPILKIALLSRQLAQGVDGLDDLIRDRCALLQHFLNVRHAILRPSDKALYTI